jgi:hypothetical protein
MPDPPAWKSPRANTHTRPATHRASALSSTPSVESLRAIARPERSTALHDLSHFGVLSFRHCAAPSTDSEPARSSAAPPPCTCYDPPDPACHGQGRLSAPCSTRAQDVLGTVQLSLAPHARLRHVLQVCCCTRCSCAACAALALVAADGVPPSRAAALTAARCGSLQGSRHLAELRAVCCALHIVNLALSLYTGPPPRIASCSAQQRAVPSMSARSPAG